MKTNTQRWFEDTLTSLQDDVEFRLESLILQITEQISAAMEKQRINRSELAKILGVSPPAITKILNGSANFTLRTLLSLADALNLNLVVKYRERATPLGQFTLYSTTSISGLNFEHEVKTSVASSSDLRFSPGVGEQTLEKWEKAA